MVKVKTEKRGEFIRFEREMNVSKMTKTQVWNVISVKSGDMLGRIWWYSNWRQYIFAPMPGCLFNPTCMDQISEKAKSLTQEHRAHRAEIRRELDK